MSAEATTPDLHPLQTVAACTAGVLDNLDQLPAGRCRRWRAHRSKD